MAIHIKICTLWFTNESKWLKKILLSFLDQKDGYKNFKLLMFIFHLISDGNILFFV